MAEITAKLVKELREKSGAGVMDAKKALVEVDGDIEKAIEAVKSEVSKNEFIRHKYSTRFLSIKLLENDPDIERIVRTLPNADEIFHVRDKMSKRVQDTMNEDCESAITDAKYGFISGALKETFTDNHLEQAQTTKVLDSIVTHRVWGFPIFFLFMNDIKTPDIIFQGF